jgi:hypothetical protein
MLTGFGQSCLPRVDTPQIQQQLHDGERRFRSATRKESSLKLVKIMRRILGQALALGRVAKGYHFAIVMNMWSHYGSPNMYVRQLRCCTRSVAQYFIPGIDVFAVIRGLALTITYADPPALTFSLAPVRGQPNLVPSPP